MALETAPWDSAEILDSNEAIEAYLIATCEDGTPSEIAHALGVVARASGMSELSAKTGLSRQALYKALSGQGNPEFATIAKVADGLGFRLTVVRSGHQQEAA